MDFPKGLEDTPCNQKYFNKSSDSYPAKQTEECSKRWPQTIQNHFVIFGFCMVLKSRFISKDQIAISTYT